jgi:hypothetical protein
MIIIKSRFRWNMEEISDRLTRRLEIAQMADEEYFKLVEYNKSLCAEARSPNNVAVTRY